MEHRRGGLGSVTLALQAATAALGECEQALVRTHGIACLQSSGTSKLAALQSNGKGAAHRGVKQLRCTEKRG